MKFISFLFFPLFLFSFELEFSKSFQHKLAKDVLRTNLTIIINDKSELKVEERLNLFDNKIKSFNNLEKERKNFTIKPIYRHSLNTPVIKEYKGELRYEINANKATLLNDFISNITKLKNNRDTTVSVKNPIWEVEEETYNVSLDLLRLEAINWAKRYSRNLSNDLNKECKVKKIFMNTNQQLAKITEKAVYTNNPADTKFVPVPKTEQEKIIISPKFVLECK